jgi:Asp-tRNA(Asn)/Glu-tRNA(Gln) amidotransferase B subunit
MELDRYTKSKLGISPGTWKTAASSTKHEASDMLPENERINTLPLVVGKDKQEGLAKLAALFRDGVITEKKARELVEKFYPAGDEE